MKVLTEKKGKTLKVILNNPAKMNCMGFEMLEQLEEKIVYAAVEQSISLIIIEGAGERALACDFRIATEESVFASPELQHGWLPGWGGMTRLHRLVGETKAKEIVMLNQRYSARQAHAMGLVTEVVTTDEVEKVMNDYSQQLASLKPEAFKLAKAALQDQNRATNGADVQFDVLAMQIAKQSE